MKYRSFPDIVGQNFGKIVVLENLKDRKVLIKCNCGIEKIVNRYDVFNGKIKSCGSKKCIARSKNLTGQRFSLLTVIEEANVYKNIGGGCTQWKCQCDCGNILIVPSNQLNSKRTKSCGCAKGVWISEKVSIPIKERVENQLYTDYRRNAEKRNLEFNLTKNEFVSFLYKNCFYCGAEPLNCMTKIKITGEEFVKFNGIDRMNNKIGYQLNNCVTCCKLCNHAKNNLSMENFIKLAKSIVGEFNMSEDNIKKALREFFQIVDEYKEKNPPPGWIIPFPGCPNPEPSYSNFEKWL